MIKIFIILNLFMINFASAQNWPIDVYIIGGQSNATGQAYLKNMPTAYEIDTNVLIYYSKFLDGGGSPETWDPLCQASESPDRFGVELSMGTELQKLNPNKKIAIIKHALSGSNLYKQWYPGKNNRDVENFGKEYSKFIHTVDNALDQLKAMGYAPKIEGMVWQQGEADARDIAGLENSRSYGQNLQHFIKSVRKQLDAKRMLFVYGYVIPVPLPRFAGREEVREAQRKIDQNSGDKLSVKRAFVIPTDDLQLRKDDFKTPYPNDVVHFGTEGILELGKRFALKLNEESK